MNIYSDVIGSTIDDRYYIERYLGEGGFGKVFLAEHRIFDIFFRKVALKIFKEEQITKESAAETFADAITLAKLMDQNKEHEGCRHLINVYDISILKDLDNRGYIAMEYINGGDLHQKIYHKQNPLPINVALSYIKQICMGLTVLHGYKSSEGKETPIVHRDLKSANVLFDNQGKVKIADFGLAIAIDNILGDAAQAGTIHCQAPESFDRFSNDPRSDIYSLGLMFYEMLTKKHPFKDVGQRLSKENNAKYIKLQEEARKKFEKEKKPPSHWNIILKKEEKLDELIMKCLNYYPGDRYKDAMDLLKAIQYLEDGDPPEDEPDTNGMIQEAIEKGEFYLSKENYTEALSILEKINKEEIVVRHKEKIFPHVYFALGRAYFKTGKYQEAFKNYKQGLKIKPLGKYYLEIAELYRTINRPNLAEVMKKRAEELPFE